MGGAFAVACGTGGTTYDFSGYRIHRFDANGTFVAIQDCNIEVLVVAGGGGGGKGSSGVNYGAGGGGGTVTYNGAYNLTSGNKTVAVGAGGNGGLTSTNGNNSIFDTITSTGGTAASTSRVGGSNANYTGGTGATENFSSGGGAGGGGNGNGGATGTGGIGYTSDINGTSFAWAGGGGGVKLTTGQAGGISGGGAGEPTAAKNPGTTNTGGGGGGGDAGVGGGAGGSGVVILRYLYKPTITFNVYARGTSTNLTGVNMDCNGTIYDLTNQSSPFTKDMNAGGYSCAFSKTGYDTNTITVDTNKGTITVYLGSSWWDASYLYKIPLILRTSQMGLSADFSQDHVILIDINSTNTSFWNNVNKPSSYDTNQYVWKSTGLNLDTNLISYWKMNESSGNAIDSKGGNTGTASNILAYNITSGYTGGKGMRFNATNSYLDVANESSFDFNTNNAFTCSGWFNFVTVTNSIMLSKLDTAANQYKGWECYMASGKLTLQLINNAGSSIIAQKYTNASYAGTGWNFFTITYSGSGTAAGIKLYINGVENTTTTTGSDTLSGYPILNNVNLTLGNRIAHGNGFDGNLSDLAVFNKALSASEVLALYNSYLGGNDIRFINKDNNVKLNWHYEDLNFDSNKLVAWVGITDTFSKTIDYNINMYYGNSNVTTDLNIISTYPSTYTHNYHFNEKSGNIAYDYQKDLNFINTSATIGNYCKIGLCYNYNGTSAYLEGMKTIQFDTGNFSILTWIDFNKNINATNFNQIWNSGFNGGNSDFELTDSNTPNWGFYARDSVGSSASIGPTINIHNNIWHMMTVTRTGSTYIGYNDVNNSGTGSGAAGDIDVAGIAPRIGNGLNALNARFANGYIDELKIFNYVLAQDEIKLLFYDMNENNTYVLKGTQQSTIDLNYNITFNVNMASTAHTLLSGINMQCSGTSAYDFNNQSMPKTISMTQNNYTCSFSKTGYDTNTVSFTVSADRNVDIDLKLTGWWNMDWNYHQALTLKTSSMGLSADVTQDHVILVDINSTNTSFWTNVSRPYSYNINQYAWKSTGANLDTNLRAYYNLDQSSGSITDSKNGITGTATDVNYSITGAYIGSKALSFLLSSSKVSLDDGNFDFERTTPFSVGFWYKGSSVSNNIISKVQAVSPYTGWEILTDGKGYVGVNFINDAAAGNNYLQTFVTDTNIGDQQWHYIVLSYSGSSNAAGVTFYIDNKLQTTKVTNKDTLSATMLNSQNLTIGNRPAGGSRLGATLDEVSIWANRALTASEASSLYNSYFGGKDIRFINKDNNVKLNWHYEDLNFDTNRLIAWVGVTDIFPSATDLNINIYYGNSGVTTDANSILTYPTTYISAWHFNNSLIATDSTISGYNGTNTAITTSTGKIGNAYLYNGSSSRVALGNKTNLLKSNTSTFSIINWLNKTDNPSSGSRSASLTQNGNATKFTYGLDLNTSGALNMYICKSSSACNNTSTGILSNSTWYHSVITYQSGANGMSQYLSGVLTKQTTYSQGATATSDLNADIGTYGATGYWKGLEDEVKILNYVISADEIKVLYNGENDNSTYLLEGAQEQQNPPTDTNQQVTFNVYNSNGTPANLSSVNMDCNNNNYDFNNQSSPFTKPMSTGTYSCIFSKTNYDSNTIVFAVTADRNVDVNLRYSNWWNTDWNYKQPLTLKTSQMGLSADVNQDHVILVDINSTNTNFWTSLKRDGNSIRFVNKDNNVKLNWHYEDLNFDINRLIAWVGVTDTFPSASDYNINMYYGNSSVTTDANALLTYPTTYLSNWHLKNNATDSKGSNNGTITGATATTGKIGTGLSFNGSSNRINFTDNTLQPTAYSILSWYKISSCSNYPTLIQNQYVNESTVTYRGWILYCSNSDSKLRLQVDGLTGGASTSPVNDGNWRFGVGTFSSGNTAIYDNNIAGTTSSGKTTTYGSTSALAGALYVSNSSSYNYFWSSLLDEMKVLNYAVSANEVTLLYNEENNNSKYLLQGAQETQGGGSDPCAPPINTDWNITTAIVCTGNTINIGTGALILSPGGSLKLNTTTVTANKIKLFSPGNLIYIYSGSSIRIK
jgi:hypothetical protein